MMQRLSRALRLYFYLVGYLLTVPIVITIFKLIPEKQVAAVFAGGLFLILPTTFLMIELVKYRRPKSLTVLGIAQFELLSAIPIFLLRVTNWNISFSELSLFGFSGLQLHSFSNVSFTLMATLTLIDAIVQTVRKPVVA